METKAETRDWLAVMLVGGCGSSFARGSNRHETIERCKRIAKADWKSLFKFEKGKEVQINVIDVTGHDEVAWDYSGFYDTKTKEPLTGIQKETVVY
jgi:hypothetical protein